MPQAQMDATEPVPPSPGYQTTEFWLSLIAMAVGILMTSGIIKPGTPWDKAIGMVATVLAAMGYQVARSTTKSAAAKADSVKFAATKGVSVGPSTAVLFLLGLLLPLMGGCTNNPAVSPEQNKLDNARTVFDVGKRVMSVLIATGYVAKNDKTLQEFILNLAKKGDECFDKAQTYVTAGDKLNFAFWFDQAMTLFDEFMTYKAAGENKHRLSNPATRPALPTKGTIHASSTPQSHPWSGDFDLSGASGRSGAPCYGRAAAAA